MVLIIIGFDIEQLTVIVISFFKTEPLTSYEWLGTYSEILCTLQSPPLPHPAHLPAPPPPPPPPAPAPPPPPAHHSALTHSNDHDHVFVNDDR